MEDSLSPLFCGTDQIIVSGDWHRSGHQAVRVIQFAADHGIRVVLHVGDFGFNHRGVNAMVFERPVAEMARKCGVTVVFIEGNHDNHAWLQSLPVRSDGFVSVAGDAPVYYAPRGHKWNWGELVFGALGGAYSVSNRMFVPGFSWHQELEQVNQHNVDTLGDDWLDVLITHEAPFGAPLVAGYDLPFHVVTEAQKSQHMVTQAIERSRPRHLFHGHWHQRIEYSVTRTSDHGLTHVHGLDKQGTDGNSVIFNLMTQSITPVGNLWDYQSPVLIERTV